MFNSFSSRDFAAVASEIDTSNRTTSAAPDFTFWPATASCSVRAAIRASDSLSFASAWSCSP